MGNEGFALTDAQLARRSRYFLNRAIEAEARADTLQHKLDEIRGRLAAAMDMDVQGAIRALSWISRAETAEELLHEVLRRVRQRSIQTQEFPTGWVSRAEAQMKMVEVVSRDAGASRPDWHDYWATEDSPEGRHILRDRR